MATLAAERTRLPGVTFRTEPPLPESSLPRMDIAAFVGFAAAGPIDVPVEIEDVASFRDIFGPDLPLARDEKGNAFQAYLAPAVEAFFNHGGRRCWVVRVAEQPSYHRFAPAGLVRADLSILKLLPATVRARCPGSWAGALKTQGMLTAEFFSFDLTWNSDASRFELAVSFPEGEIVVGDLLRLNFKQQELVGFIVVESVSRTSSAKVTVFSRETYWFLQNPFDPATKVYHHKNTGVETLGVPTDFSQTDEGYVLQLDPEWEIENGDLLRVNTANGRILLPVSQTRYGLDSSDNKVLEVVAERGFRPRTRIQAIALLGDTPWRAFGARLSMELLVFDGMAAPKCLRKLGFCSTHPRALQTLEVDQDLFERRFTSYRDPQNLRTTESVLQRQAAQPRFPLAADENAALVYLPLALADIPDVALATGPLEQDSEADRLVRDGLEKFSSAMFLDAELMGHTTGALLDAANNRYYVEGEALRGLHALLPLEEVSLVAIPDAVHQGWELGPPPADGIKWLEPPELAFGTFDDPETPNLTWSDVAGTSYRLEGATSADFDPPEQVVVTAKLEADVDLPASCPRVRYFRVRAESGTLLSPWSNTVSRILPVGDFKTCSFTWPAAPVLDPLPELEPGDDAVILSWSGDSPFWLVESAGDPAFLTAETLYLGDELSVRVLVSEVTYYRVRGQEFNSADTPGTLSPWSNTVRYAPPPENTWRPLESDFDPSELLALHRAPIRFCAARTDMNAALAMPLHFREVEALDYLRQLLPSSHSADYTTVPALVYDETPALDYAALYHPWPALALQDGTREAIPPDGPMIGLMAARALGPGAWIAPANQMLANVVSLEQSFDDAVALRFFRNRINLLRQEPRGFAIMSADTLAESAELGNINVRRLIILLRRVLQREGRTMVFQPNDANFQRLAKRRFDRVLYDLFQRGAFKGTMPEEGFRVTVDKLANDRTAADNGRFVLEIRFAPSQPLAFLTVRLVQSAETGTQVKES